MDSNYEKILEKISRLSGIDKDEIKRKIEAKRAKLSNLISYEGAAQIVAVELGINLEEERLKINELVSGIRRANIIGEIIEKPQIRKFKNNKGEEMKVANLIVADDTSNIRVVLWDTNHISLIENNTISEGTVVEIKNAAMRGSELHLGNFSDIKPCEEVFENVVRERAVKEKHIEDFFSGDYVKNRSFVVQSFMPRFFYICPECKKKTSTDGENYICLEHGNVSPEKRVLMNIILDDGTNTIRAVLFNDLLKILGVTNLDDAEKLSYQREDLLGKEFIFSGSVRMNKFFNELEFIIDKIDTIDIDELIKSLEN